MLQMLGMSITTVNAADCTTCRGVHGRIQNSILLATQLLIAVPQHGNKLTHTQTHVRQLMCF